MEQNIKFSKNVVRKARRQEIKQSRKVEEKQKSFSSESQGKNKIVILVRARYCRVSIRNPKMIEDFKKQLTNKKRLFSTKVAKRANQLLTLMRIITKWKKMEFHTRQHLSKGEKKKEKQKLFLFKNKNSRSLRTQASHLLIKVSAWLGLKLTELTLNKQDNQSKLSRNKRKQSITFQTNLEKFQPIMINQTIKQINSRLYWQITSRLLDKKFDLNLNNLHHQVQHCRTKLNKKNKQSLNLQQNKLKKEIELKQFE